VPPDEGAFNSGIGRNIDDELGRGHVILTGIVGKHASATEGDIVRTFEVVSVKEVTMREAPCIGASRTHRAVSLCLSCGESKYAGQNRDELSEAHCYA